MENARLHTPPALLKFLCCIKIMYLQLRILSTFPNSPLIDSTFQFPKCHSCEMSNNQTLYLPDTMKDWPWKRNINPFYEEVKTESEAWFHSFRAFTPESQLAFDKCNFSKLHPILHKD